MPELSFLELGYLVFASFLLVRFYQYLSGKSGSISVLLITVLCTTAVSSLAWLFPVAKPVIVVLSVGGAVEFLTMVVRCLNAIRIKEYREAGNQEEGLQSDPSSAQSKLRFAEKRNEGGKKKGYSQEDSQDIEAIRKQKAAEEARKCMNEIDEHKKEIEDLFRRVNGLKGSLEPALNQRQAEAAQDSINNMNEVRDFLRQSQLNDAEISPFLRSFIGMKE